MSALVLRDEATQQWIYECELWDQQRLARKRRDAQAAKEALHGSKKETREPHLMLTAVVSAVSTLTFLLAFF